MARSPSVFLRPIFAASALHRSILSAAPGLFLVIQESREGPGWYCLQSSANVVDGNTDKAAIATINFNVILAASFFNRRTAHDVISPYRAPHSTATGDRRQPATRESRMCWQRLAR